MTKRRVSLSMFIYDYFTINKSPSRSKCSFFIIQAPNRILKISQALFQAIVLAVLIEALSLKEILRLVNKYFPPRVIRFRTTWTRWRLGRGRLPAGAPGSILGTSMRWWVKKVFSLIFLWCARSYDLHPFVLSLSEAVGVWNTSSCKIAGWNF